MKNDPDYEDLHLILDVIKNLLKLPDDKSLTPFDKIQLATEKLRCAGLASFFNFSEDPYTLLHLRLYHCDFVIGNIFICRAKAHNKKKATFEAAQQGYFCFYNLLENNELETLENAHEETQVLETDDISSKELKLNVVVDKNIENSSAKTDALPTYLENNSASSRSEHPSSQFHEFTVNRHIISSNTTISKDANLSLNSECNVQRFNKWKSIKKGFKVNEELLKNSLEKEMVVFDKAESDITLSSAAILNMSATKCHKKLTVHFNLEDNNSICCHYYLDNEEIGTGCAFLKQEAKLTAALNARRNLEKQFYTILIKNDIEDPIFVSREQIRVLEAKSLGVLSENNIGFKMMKTMGWAGGGIGKNSGRTEPIIVDQHSYNQGLGFSIGKTEKTAMKTKDFKQKVETVLREYSACNSKSDLVFSADFDKEERKMIHKLTEKYPNLQSSSYGKNEGRQLRIKRKSKGIEILKELLQAEGSTNRYELIDKSN
ncbi:uncharacterized protein CEXT_24891 [Caerostris extrusa]|uniref:NF-kappa-B-repressing factor n=1 Tax=Caerostris extrusa TaxID=172846 RepID=A0AAV4Q825_CAEEX|nr:uncharacterized protein CEXT_24891 [Caerostris extrusa]